MVELYNKDSLSHEAIRRKATFFIPGEKYDYIKKAAGGYTHPIDPATGRGFMQVKKGVVGFKADVDGNLSSQNSPLHTYIIRMADVYLTHAEACLGNQDELTGGRGLESFNAVRNRAGAATKDKITFQDLIDERRIEFCMEYQNWFDMVSWYRWKPDYMLDYFNKKQYRAYLLNDKDFRVNADGSLSYHLAYYSVNGQEVWDTVEGYDEIDGGIHHTPTVVTSTNIWIPYPESDVLQNPYLKSPIKTEPYDFDKYDK